MQPYRSSAQTLLILLVLSLVACGQVLAEDPKAPPSPTPTLVLEQLSLVDLMPSSTSLSPIAVATPSPSPSPTPVPTPTPIIYVVEPGDTVLGIAAQYDVTVEAIQLANPGLRPELLQIDQQITIPLPLDDPNIRDHLLPAVEQLPLAIKGFDLYETPVGGILGIGEVLNGTEFPAENVRVSVKLYSHVGDLLHTMDAWIVSDIILPGESAPFGVLFVDPPAGPLTPRVSLESSEKATQIEQRFADLRVSSHQGGMAGSIYRVTGIIANVGQYDTSDVSLVVTLYSEDNRVTGFRKTILSSPLAAGASTAFDVWLSPGGLPVHHHVVTVAGRADTINE